MQSLRCTAPPTPATPSPLTYFAMTIANQLTILRIILVPPIIVCIAYARFIEALVLFLIAGITDALDGYLARRRGENTKLGMLLDPLADKLLVGATFLALAIPVQTLAVSIPPWLAILSIGRDAAILAGVTACHLAFGPRSFPPSWLGKATTALHLIVISWVLAGNVFRTELPGTHSMFIVASILVVASAVHYAFIGQRIVSAVETQTDASKAED